jgi:hypothetical protein
LFLEIVHQAQSEGIQTAGAGNAGRVAAFLTEAEQRSAHLPEDADAARVIDDLVATPAPQVEAPAADGPSPVSEWADDAKPVPSPTKDDDVLSELTGESSPTPPKPTKAPPPSPAPTSAPPKKTDADQDLLDDLMGK